MAEIPYITTAGSITKILEKIKEAQTPESFSQEFLRTKLGFKGGNYQPFIPWAKKAGLLNSDGTPTSLYKQFRNPSTSAVSLAVALRTAYAELYSRNEYCHELDRKDFKGLVMEATGEAHDSAKVEKIVATFFNAKPLADFAGKLNSKKEATQESEKEISSTKSESNDRRESKNKLNLGLNYTINLVLPKTDDPAIYNAIFKSLKENLLND
ncbi:MAG: DUF5343 domain-containing protein [Mucilaginibacter sp.]|uniref:DUF5343 domain-containing protein n=1 Tax=Mucilaginibacter sp. TaxID=1882438 RepID=UPI0031B4D9B6